jgi:ribosome-binding factor A
MTFRRISRKDLLSAAAEIGEQDGSDPRFDRDTVSTKVPNRKALLLCGQIARALSDVLAGCGDDALRDLLIESVAPAPTSVRLLVTVRRPADVDEATVHFRLEAARGLLRHEIAAAIHRRKTPELLFRVVK